MTKYQYTGQYSYASEFGLHFYNARWYDSSLGRFTQADSIIPPGVQGYERYARTQTIILYDILTLVTPGLHGWSDLGGRKMRKY